MIKEKLMSALKMAADEYNGGTGANASVVKAAEAADFNEQQTYRLLEMFNTALALRQEKDAECPEAPCELAVKSEVSKMLLDRCSSEKLASCPAIPDYSFYSSSPCKTNPSIEARMSGTASMCKAASEEKAPEPEGLNVSQRSLYKMIENGISRVKAASCAADEATRGIRMCIDQNVSDIAKAIEYDRSPKDMADMFKMACSSSRVVAMVSECSTTLADSDGGAYAKAEVFDSSPVDGLINKAAEIEDGLSLIQELEAKRDMYASKAHEAEREVMEALGIKSAEDMDAIGTSRLSDMVSIQAKSACSKAHDGKTCDGQTRMSSIQDKIEKIAAPITAALAFQGPSLGEGLRELAAEGYLDGEEVRKMNIRRSMILEDLLFNDPIIRDADPNVVAEAYKTMVMASPRVSLDKAQVRAFLRSAVNSVAISPSDAKVITDVDKGMSLANVDRLTALDSSMKDSLT